MLKQSLNILIVALLLTTTFAVQRNCLDALDVNSRVSIFYIPAAVITIASLTLGYRAAIGIFLGGLVINFWLYPHVSPVSNILISLVPALVCALTIFIMRIANGKLGIFLRPGMGYTDIDAIDVLYFCILHSVLNTSIHQFIYYCNSEYDAKSDVYNFFSMMLGDLTGSFLVFVLLNLGFTALKIMIRARPNKG